MVKYKLTLKDIKQLKAKIKELEQKILPELADKIQEARADGDLRENEPYQILRQKFESLKAELEKYKYMLDNHELVGKGERDVVGLGEKIEIEIGGSKRQVIQIVSEIQANPLENKFSELSPIGQALLGKRVGDSVKLGNGQEIVIVRKVG